MHLKTRTNNVPQTLRQSYLQSDGQGRGRATDIAPDQPECSRPRGPPSAIATFGNTVLRAPLTGAPLEARTDAENVIRVGKHGTCEGPAAFRDIREESGSDSIRTGQILIGFIRTHPAKLRTHRIVGRPSQFLQTGAKLKPSTGMPVCLKISSHLCYRYSHSYES
jgi:hypothetical protein